MKTYEASVKVAAPADKAAAMMATAEYAREEALIDGAVKAKARIEKTDGNLVTVVIDREDPSRGPGGKIANKTEKNTITQKWDLAAMRCEWSVKVPGMERMVFISGTTWLETAGDGKCTLREKGSVSLKVPLIGDIVAAGIVADIKKDFARKGPFIEKFLAGK